MPYGGSSHYRVSYNTHKKSSFIIHSHIIPQRFANAIWRVLSSQGITTSILSYFTTILKEKILILLVIFPVCSPTSNSQFTHLYQTSCHQKFLNSNSHVSCFFTNKLLPHSRGSNSHQPRFCHTRGLLMADSLSHFSRIFSQLPSPISNCALLSSPHSTDAHN